MKRHPGLGGESAGWVALGSPLGSCLVVASAWEVKHHVLMAYEKTRLGTKGEMVAKMGMKGSPSYFLQWYFLHKLLLGCSRFC